MARRAADMSPLALAYKAGITPATVYRIERGDVTPHAATLRAIAQVLDLDPGELGVRTDEAA